MFFKSLKPLNIIKINSQNLLANYDLIQNLKPECQIWPVVKSEAYGHGLKQIAIILKQRKFDYLIVDSYYEALKIWEVSNQPVLIMGQIRPENFAFMKWKKVTIMVQDRETVKELGKLKKKVKIHLKINTGMNRQGIEFGEIESVIKLIKQYKNIEIEGIFSHLADADNYKNNYTTDQLKIFKKAIEMVEKMGINLKYCHLAATAGTLKINDPKINVLRLGIGLYGFNPLDKSDKNFKKLKFLKPVLKMNSVLIKVRELEMGEKVGYNCKFEVKEKTMIGIMPVGYFEALDRRLSNNGFVKYKNKIYPIIGNICMNMVIVNLGKVKGKLFDEVEIISDKTEDKNSISNMAKICKTIPYEILVKLNESIRREII